MKHINLTLYSFDELSEESSKKVVENERWNVMEDVMDGYSSDYRKSLNEFENLFHIRCNWEVNYCGYSFSFKLTSFEAFEWQGGYIELATLSGKLLQRFLRNYILPHLENPACYFSKMKGVYPNFRYNKRFSKIKKIIECPFTGHIYDMLLLDPLLRYLASPNDGTNYAELMDKCLRSFFMSWHEEYEYWADDDEAVKEELRNNQYENRLYYSNGDVYTGPLELSA